MSVRRWNPARDGPLSEAALRRTLEKAGYRVAKYIYPPGTHFPEHTHDVDKIDAVVSGCFRLVIEGRSFDLRAGDRIAVPKRIRHSASVVGDEPVVSLDAVKEPT
jgi:quercetin dioxygenase-like cupin family protein